MEEIKKRWKFVGAAIIILILFLCVRGCINKQTNTLRGENNQLEKQVEILKDGVRVAYRDHEKFRDSISIETIKKEQQIKDLEKKTSESQERLKNIEKSAEKSKIRVKNMTYVAIADTLNSIYSTKEASATNNSVDIKGSLANRVLETVVEANFAQDIIKEKDFQLFNKDSVIVFKDTELKNSSLLLFSAEKTLKASRELNELQSDFNKNLEKENSKLRTQSTLNKILIPIAGAIGVFIGVKTNK